MFILFCEGFFYYSYFTFSFIKTKFEAFEKIAELKDNDNINSTLVKIPVINLDKDESDEVWYHKELYDVVKREVSHDTSYVYLLPDNDEEDLITNNYNYFKTDTDNYCKGDFFKINHTKVGKNTIDQYYLFTNRRRIALYAAYIFTSTINNRYATDNADSEVPSPPPKKSLL